MTPAAELSLEVAIREHDRNTASTELWMGAEPTFTDRHSQAPEWLSEALGAEKEARARRLIQRLADAHPGAIILRPLGRQYAKEPAPRFCYGLYARRDGEPVWSGPPDRLHDGVPAEPSPASLAAFTATLRDALRKAGWFAESVASAEPSTARLLLRPDGQSACSDPASDERLARPSVHAMRIEGAGLIDVPAAEGSYLLLIHAGAGAPDHNELWLELPQFRLVEEFLRFLELLAASCRALEVSSLGIRGFAPPVDASVAWTAMTPDPAVLEVNQAPYPDMQSFHRANRLLFELAAEIGLSPYRLQYNGAVSDSGGGGQLTFGGPSPERSPFFACPALLPRLIRYLIEHPSLSYWFATQYVGGSSQSPRPDEGTRESFLELEVALEQLALLEAPTPALLWGTLRHFLADASGNPHRSALNIEKLDNPFLPGRGRLGLVEFRALAMARGLGVSTARAMLFRSVVALLMREDRVPQLRHWGDTLHDRFPLPFYLELDLRAVLADLARAGLGLGPEFEALLLQRDDGLLAATELEDCWVRVEQALEFWPLVGDVATQEAGGSRLVDASTSRIQVLIGACGSNADSLHAIQASANGHHLPLRAERGAQGPVRVHGLRFRSFLPRTGIHPSIPAEQHIALTFEHPSGSGLRVTLHPWRPDGGAYDGLPASLGEARSRRLERAVIERVDASALSAPRKAPSAALTPHVLDLRRLRTPPSHPE